MPLTRSSVSPIVRDGVLAALATALEGYDAVIITLQHVYPKHQPVDPAVLTGGDRALYNILASDPTDTTATSGDYDVEMVEVTLSIALDPETSKYMIHKGTTMTEENVLTKLLVPTKLTTQHRVLRADQQYLVQALRVTRKM